ncbi:MAG: FMN-binding negative transcriptional regulator [Proteobacteria bacterium]|nr:FMN-binding negative transcriptional regulator [Pseudomonadota bacterium]
MYRPRHYDIDDVQVLHRFMRDQSFALLVTAPEGVPTASHIPLFLDTESDGPDRLLGHVAKANTQWRDFDGKTEAMAMFWGPHAYISPSWYESEKVVPTWNYVTVHAYGKPRVLAEPKDARDVLARLIDAYESDATGNWSMDRLEKTYAEKMVNGIVAFEMPIGRLEGKFKLNQKSSATDREGAIRGLRQTGDAEAEEVARLMEKFNPAD